MSKLTRRGARNVTATLDRIANLMQSEAEALGIDPKIAADFALRCDMISDAVERTAMINFPKKTAAAMEADVLKVLKSGPAGVPWTTDEVWVALNMKDLSEKLQRELISENLTDKFWDTPAGDKAVEKFEKADTSALNKLLQKLSDSGKLEPKIKTHGGGGTWKVKKAGGRDDLALQVNLPSYMKTFDETEFHELGERVESNGLENAAKAASAKKRAHGFDLFV
jgi:hypothetical protein